RNMIDCRAVRTTDCPACGGNPLSAETTDLSGAHAMSAAPASTAFLASRRRLFGALFSSAGIEDGGLAMRRPGRDGLREKELPQSPDALSFPPEPVRWLTRCTFGYSIPELMGFNTLGANDDARWIAWVNQQLNPANIDDTVCDARVASAGFVTL